MPKKKLSSVIVVANDFPEKAAWKDISKFIMEKNLSNVIGVANTFLDETVWIDISKFIIEKRLSSVIRVANDFLVEAIWTNIKLHTGEKSFQSKHCLKKNRRQHLEITLKILIYPKSKLKYTPDMQIFLESSWFTFIKAIFIQAWIFWSSSSVTPVL